MIKIYKQVISMIVTNYNLLGLTAYCLFQMEHLDLKPIGIVKRQTLVVSSYGYFTFQASVCVFCSQMLIPSAALPCTLEEMHVLSMRMFFTSLTYNANKLLEKVSSLSYFTHSFIHSLRRFI